MATEYGVNVSNKFAFLDDDDDPVKVIERLAKEKKEKAKQAKEQKAVPAPVKPVANNNETEQRRGLPPNRAGPRGPRRDGQEQGERRPGPRRDGPPRDGPRRDGPPRDGPRRSGDFKPRPPRQDGEVALDEDGKPVRRFPRRERDAQPRRPPRTDRTSGSDKTGVRSVPKKDGHGKGNWGDDQDELVGETEKLNVEENKENGVEVSNAEAEQPAEEEKEPEAPKLTLSEWKAQQKLEKQEFKTRKANEGADQKALQKFVPLKKDDENNGDSDEDEEDGIALTKRQQSQKTVDIRVSFNDPNRRERGEFRGPRNFNNDRRGPRRDGPPAPSRGAPRHGAQIDLNHDFPALGAH